MGRHSLLQGSHSRRSGSLSGLCYRQISLLALLTNTCLLLLALPVHSSVLQQDYKQQMDTFFSSVDEDGNGQIEEAEARRYIGQSFGSNTEPVSSEQLNRAVKQMTQNLDSKDVGHEISEAEVDSHLRTLLKGTPIREWIKHAVGLAQYANTFRDNAVTALDFPLLVNDGGATLQNDLGVKSKLHQQQLIRAMKRVMLGLGNPPSAPQAFRCRALDCGAAVVCSWTAPLHPGNPALHKYRLQRHDLTHGAAALPGQEWRTVVDDLDEEALSFVEQSVEVGDFEYKLAAWNRYGSSPKAVSEVVHARPSNSPCSAADQAALEFAVAASDRAEATDNQSHVLPPGTSAKRKKQSASSGLWAWLAASGSTLLVVVLTVASRFLSEASQRQLISISKRVANSVGLANFLQLMRSNLRWLVSWRFGSTDEHHRGLNGGEDHAGHSAAKANGVGVGVQTAPQGVLKHGPAAEDNLQLGAAGTAYARGNSSRQLPHSASARALKKSGSGRSNASGRALGETLMAANADHDSNDVDEEGDEDAHSQQHVSFAPSTSQGQGGSSNGQDVQAWLHHAPPVAWPSFKSDSTAGTSQRCLQPMEDEEGGGPTGDPQERDRNRCCHDGCTRRFDSLSLRSVKHSFLKHYCGQCQRVYCIYHTRISPHGMTGSCGLDSKCLCLACFAALPPDRQAQLDKFNKLDVKER